MSVQGAGRHRGGFIADTAAGSPAVTVTPVVAAAESEQPLGVADEIVLPTLPAEELSSSREGHSHLRYEGLIIFDLLGLYPA